MTLKTTGEEDVLFLGMEENKTEKNHTFRLPHSLQFRFAAHNDSLTHIVSVNLASYERTIKFLLAGNNLLKFILAVAVELKNELVF